jgi:plastocyanin
MRSTLVLASLVLLAACGGGGSGGNNGGNPVGPGNPGGGSPGGHAVNATTLAFNPASITIAAGDSVSWTFGSVAHTVTFQQGAAAPGDYGGATSSSGAPADISASQGTTISRRFATAGTFHYRCSIHPSMLGTVVVQ